MDAIAVVEAHIRAFNDRDLEAVMATFHDDAVFATGDLMVIGGRGLSNLFSEAFREFEARLEIRSVISDGGTVACELVEHISAHGITSELVLAGFFTVRDGRLARVKVYREGPR